MRNTHPKHIPWIGIPCWTYNMSLGRSRVHMGKGITRLCRDLNHLQRTRAETGPRQWLKTRCYDLTTLVAYDIDVLICWLIYLVLLILLVFWLINGICSPEPKRLRFLVGQPFMRWVKTQQNFKNKGHLGSRHMYIYISNYKYIYIYIATPEEDNTVTS